MSALSEETDEDLIGRLYNWKFDQALRYLRDDHPTEVRDEVKKLAEEFGNCGWIDGTVGEAIRLRVEKLIGSDE